MKESFRCRLDLKQGPREDTLIVWLKDIFTFTGISQEQAQAFLFARIKVNKVIKTNKSALPQSRYSLRGSGGSNGEPGHVCAF